MPRFELLKVTSSRSVSYFDYGTDLLRPPMNAWKTGEKIKNNTKGEFTKKSKSRFSSLIINWLSVIDAIKFANIHGYSEYSDFLTFVTLTLSSNQMHSDLEIRRNMLNPFLKKLKTKYNVKSYLYCSEAQRNGNIHFHIVIDKKIHHKQIRSIWNGIQNVSGYINCFEIKHGHTNPNSTDIHSFKKIKSIAAYLIKYFTKDQSRRKIEGHLWGASDNLREIVPFTTPVTSGYAELLNRCCTDEKIFVRKGDFWTVFRHLSFEKIFEMNPKIGQEILQHYQGQINLI